MNEENTVTQSQIINTYVSIHDILEPLVVAFSLPRVYELLPQRRSAGATVRRGVLLLDELVEHPAQLGDRLAYPIPDNVWPLVLKLVDHLLQLGVVAVEPVAVFFLRRVGRGGPVMRCG